MGEANAIDRLVCADANIRTDLISEAGIDEAYRLVLGRPADPGGRAHFKSVTIRYQLTRGRLLHILADSDEFKARPAPDKQRVIAAIENASHPSEAVHWFHSIALPDGYVTNGMQRQGSVDAVFKHSIKGRSVLDIGAWDGFYSCKAEALGASDILATDGFFWGGPGWGTKAGCECARCALQSKARDQEVDLFDLEPGELGTFDVVLFLGVLYHLVDPLGGLRRAAAMCRDQLVILTHTRNNEVDRPLLEYVEGLNGDATTYFYPNIAWIKAVLSHLGFLRFEILPAPAGPENGEPRHVIHAWRA